MPARASADHQSCTKMEGQLQYYKDNVMGTSLTERDRPHDLNVKANFTQFTQHDNQHAMKGQGSMRQAKMKERVVESSQMDALEAELEAELELMQLNMSTKGSCCSDQSMRSHGEVSSKRSRHSHEMLRKSNLDTIGLQSADVDPRQVECGVSPFELDLRLREVLEARQEERIMELEALLEKTETKLQAKEQEVLCWKNHVNALTNCFQAASVCEAQIIGSSDFEATGPTISRGPAGPLKLLKAFRDPPLSSDDPNAASCEDYSDISFGGSLGLVKVISESHTSWQAQERGINTPELNEMREIEVDTPSPLQPKASFSRASELSNCSFPDDWSVDILPSCWSSCEHPHSVINDVGVRRLCSETSDSLNVQEAKFRTTSSSVTGSFSGKDGCFEFIETVSSYKSLHPRGNRPPPLEAPRRSLKFKGESLHVVTKGLRRSLTLHANSPETTKSPVLDKIRHWEALGVGVHREPSLMQ